MPFPQETEPEVLRLAAERGLETRNSTNQSWEGLLGLLKSPANSQKCWGEQTRCFAFPVGNPLLLWLVQFWGFRGKLSSLQVVQALQSPSSQSCKPKSPEWVWLRRFPAPLDSPVGRPAWEPGNVAGCTGLTWLNINESKTSSNFGAAFRLQASSSREAPSHWRPDIAPATRTTSCLEGSNLSEEDWECSHLQLHHLGQI